MQDDDLLPLPPLTHPSPPSPRSAAASSSSSAASAVEALRDAAVAAATRHQEARVAEARHLVVESQAGLNARATALGEALLREAGLAGKPGSTPLSS